MNHRDRFRELAEAHFHSIYRLLPVQATLLGLRAYDHLLGDLSAESLAQFVADSKQRQQEILQIDPDQLEEGEALERELVLADIQSNLISFEDMADWRRDPNLYVDMPLYGMFALIVRDYISVEERTRSLIARLQALPTFLELAKTNLTAAPRSFIQVAIDTAEGGREFFRQVIPSFASQTPSFEPALASANQIALEAVDRYAVFLRSELLPTAADDFAIGQTLYERKLRHEHMLDFDANELRNLGQRVFTSTEAALRELAARIDPRKEWAELIQEAREDHPSGDELLPAYRGELERLRQFVQDRQLVALPENEKLEVVETPSFARSTIPYAAYMPPAPFEEEQKGLFWVTPLDTTAAPDRQTAQLKEHCYGTIPLIALHEAYPGHHLQLVRSNNVSSPIRKHISSNLFAEGWALYCEQMMGEAGYYDSWQTQMFQLKDQLWRAARVMIDVDLQLGKITLNEAVRTLVEHVHLTEEAALTEVRRYAMTPTQPMSYMVGKQMILDLRAEFSSLSQMDFHDRLLSSGTIPLKLVRREMLTMLS